jgi:hypothetical protein
MPTISQDRDPDYLTSLSPSEVEHRIARVADRVEARASRASAENRDLNPAEQRATSDDITEAAALRVAADRQQQIETRGRAIDQALANNPRPETRAAMSEFTEALARGIPHRATLECRSVTTTLAGARGAVAAGGIGQPQWLWDAAGIPFFDADSLTVKGPKWAALVAQSATPETSTKPNMADPTLSTATLAAFAVVDEVTDQVIKFGVGPQAVSSRLASEVVFSVNAAFAEALETAAGTPVTYATSASHMADLAIARVWAKTGAKPSALLVNSADYPLLSAKAAVGPGDGISVPVVAFNGTPLVVNDSITAGIAVAVVGAGFSSHGTAVEFASLPILTTNMVTLRAEVYAGLLQHDAGAAIAVELVS